MDNKPNDSHKTDLPPCATEFIRQVRCKMRYRKKVAAEVEAEVTAHFEDELRDCTNPHDREQRARRLIEEFGDPKLLAVLCRRAKKRCRPLWCKVAVRSMQAVGVLVLYVALCSVRLLVGTPSLKVDYLAWLTERTRAGQEESLNAKPHFDKAVGLLKDEKQITAAAQIRPSWPGDMNEPQRQVVAAVAQSNAGAFEVLREGVTKPYYWVQYETAARESVPADVAARMGSMPLGTLMAFGEAVSPAMAGYRRLAQAFDASILWRAYRGDVAGAMDDSLVLMDFGMHLEGRGTQIEQLVGTALEGMASGLVRVLLEHCDVSPADLARTQNRLQQLHARHESVIDVTGDRAACLSLIQTMFTDDGAGNGRVLKQGLPLATRDWQDGVTSLLLFGYPDRREMTSLCDTFWREYESVLEMEPTRPQREERRVRWMTLAQESHFLATQASSLDRMVHLTWRLKTGRRALLATLAVMRYTKDKGTHPPTLDALVAEGYLSELPIDPYSGTAFGYQQTGDGFLLYSVGDNRMDDGGQRGVNNLGQPREYADNGDWVFWPPYVAPPTPKGPARGGMDEKKAAKYKAAAPLNHTVRIERNGSYLKLNYELIGTDGRKYSLWDIKDRSRPTFAVYQCNTKVGGGTFEFG